MNPLLPFSRIVSRASLELPADEWVSASSGSARTAVSVFNPGPASVLVLLAPRGFELPNAVDITDADYVVRPGRSLSVPVSESVDLAVALPPEADPQAMTVLEVSQ